MAKDVVCGMEVDEGKAKKNDNISKYENKTYYFCAGTCKMAFEGNPKQFIKGDKNG